MSPFAVFWCANPDCQHLELSHDHGSGRCRIRRCRCKGFTWQVFNRAAREAIERGELVPQRMAIIPEEEGADA